MVKLFVPIKLGYAAGYKSRTISSIWFQGRQKKKTPYNLSTNVETKGKFISNSLLFVFTDV